MEICGTPNLSQDSKVLRVFFDSMDNLRECEFGSEMRSQTRRSVIGTLAKSALVVMGTCLAANSFEPTGMEVPAGRVSNTMESERQFWRLSQSWGSQLYCVAGGRAKSAYNQCSKDRMVANGAVAQIIVPKKRSKWRRLVRDWWRRSRIMSRSFLCLSG